MSDITIRKSISNDLKSINKIYDQAILNGGCTCDTKPFSLNDKKNWFDSYNDSFPIYTVLSDKK